MSEFKLHHRVGELFSLLGVSYVAAEEYAEALRKTVRPFVGSQVSANDAVRRLAEGASNPEAFLSKYNELKSQNIRGLDAMVVFLGGIAKEGHLKSIIEEASKQLYADDGSQVAIPVSDSEEVSGVQMTDDQINILRNRLFNEYQYLKPNPTKVLTHSKKSAHGPEIPTSLLNRKYFTLDFIACEEKSANVAPLGEVGINSQENQLLEDILSLLTGIEGIYITVDFADEPFQPPSFSVDPSVEPSLKALVSRILPLCGHYSVVLQFIEDKSLYHHGLVKQALAAAMRNLLRDYLLLVVQLETQHKRASLTLHKLWFYVEKTLTVMEMLSCLSSSISKSGAHGGGVLSLLHERSLSLTGCGQLQEITVYLTQAAARPYMQMLSKWLHRGVISDPYQEFMVEDTVSKNDNVSGSASYELSFSDDYWKKRYILSTCNIPCFLQPFVDVILNTGKYLNVVRQSDPSVSYPDQDELVYSVQDKSYVDVIGKTYNFASKRLLQLLMKEKDLMGRLRSVKHYFLLDQGDFVIQLLSLCETELSKPIDDVVPIRLVSLLELAVRTSRANIDPYKDDVHCALLPYTLGSQLLKILSIETEGEREKWPPIEHLHLSGLQGFSLTYKVSWPLSLILDKRTLACYQMIFRHLFYCKHVERLLCRVWIGNKAAKAFPLSASCTYAAAFALRQRMLNFIQNIEYYMMFEVIERNWVNFIGKMQKVENVDKVLAFHSDFLGSCLKDCMLTSPELLRIVSKLTGLCISFANFILSPEPESSFFSESPTMTHEASESFEQTVARYNMQFTGMLVTLVLKISGMGRDEYSDALINILYRLDFNNYYTRRGETLPLSMSPEGSIECISGPPSG